MAAKRALWQRPWLPTMVAVIVIVWWPWWRFCGTQTTVLLVRDADRIAGQDQLSAAGSIRAQELVHMAEKSGVGASTVRR